MSQAPDTLLTALRATPPLVQCITNYVAMNIAANVMLAAPPWFSTSRRPRNSPGLPEP